jgi:copper chaperone
MSSTVERVSLTAPDISCAHCVATIKSEVGALPGVQLVTVDPVSKRVDVDFDASRVSPEQIEATLDEAGYPVQK